MTLNTVSKVVMCVISSASISQTFNANYAYSGNIPLTNPNMVKLINDYSFPDYLSGIQFNSGLPVKIFTMNGYLHFMVCNNSIPAGSSFLVRYTWNMA